MRFLFWNVKKNPVGSILSKIVEAHSVDVVILAECRDPGVILGDLNGATDNQFYLSLSDSPGTRVFIFTRFLREYIETAHSEDFFTVRLVSLPGTNPFLLAALHLPSKLHKTDSQEYEAFVASQVSEKIRRVERECGTSRTVLVGDLNMNPFEKGVASANGLHAVMTRGIARKGKRKVVREFYPFFYNPMWGRFGDTTEGPPGTYFRRGSEPTEYFWNTYDQVLIRPDLLDSFDEESVQVLTEVGKTKFLLKTGIPDHSRVSDHLPLLFALAI